MHLNLQFEEPLVPDAGDGWGSALDGAPERRPVDDARRPAGRRSRRRSAATCARSWSPATTPARRPGCSPSAAGWPLLAEPTSGSRTGDSAIRTYRLLLGDPDLAGRIQQVVVFGHPTLSRPVSRLLARDDIELYAVRGPVRLDRPRAPRARRGRPGRARGRRASWFASEQVDAADREPDPGSRSGARRDAELSRRLDALLAAQRRADPARRWPAR